MSKKLDFKSLTIGARSAVIVFGIAGLCGLAVSSRNVRLADYASFGLMVFLAIVTAHSKIRLFGGSSISLLTAVVLISIMMLGTPAAVLVGACGVVVQCVFPWRRLIPHHLVFNIGMIWLTASMSGIGYHWVVSGSRTTMSDQFVGSLVASLLYYFGNSLCVSLIISLSSRKSIFRLWHDNFLYMAPSFFIAGMLAFAARQLTLSFRPTALIVIVPMLYLSYYSYRVYLRSLENEKKHASEMAELFNSTLQTLVLAIDAKDRNTHGHVQRVQKYARAIAEAMQLGEVQIKAIAAAALLHDIGKLAVPEYILSKSGPLTPEEMKKMRLHPQLGAEIISNIKFPYPVTDSILAHHERWDGNGYPSGLKGEEIPLGARVLAVADVFDAYRSDRVESNETIEQAIEVLNEGAGSFFDPAIVAVWRSIYRDVVKLSPAAAHSTAYNDIQRAASEITILESLADSIAGLTAVEDVMSAVCGLLESSIPGCAAAIQSAAAGGVPVTFGGEVIATICVRRPGQPLNDDETRLVAAIAEKISGSLNNAIALETARREATVDQLTGLANRRAFEMMAATLGKQPFSIVLIDINAFKAVNDNFGHQAGDTALINVAAHLRAAFTDAPMTCRLGGDEFLVLSFADARSLRIQIRNFRKMVVWDPAHEPYKKMLFGASCGVARVPADASNIERAMQLADERMYAVKTRWKQRTASRVVTV